MSRHAKLSRSSVVLKDVYSATQLEKLIAARLVLSADAPFAESADWIMLPTSRYAV